RDRHLAELDHLPRRPWLDAHGPHGDLTLQLLGGDGEEVGDLVRQQGVPFAAPAAGDVDAYAAFPQSTVVGARRFVVAIAIPFEGRDADHVDAGRSPPDHVVVLPRVGVSF